MIVVITQTYGAGRKELYDIRSKDEMLKYFISSFDHDIYSFHNSDIETINYYKSCNFNREYLEFNGVSYTETIKLMITHLKNIGCTKLIFLQDDVFSYNQDIKDIDILINEIKNNKITMLNIEMCLTDFNNSVRDNLILSKSIDGIEIWKAFTSNFVQNGNYSFDDGPFVIDFELINVIFDQNFFKIGDVWAAENYNNDKFKNIDFPRYITNKIFFKRYNIVGRNNWDRNNELERLKKNFLK